MAIFGTDFDTHDGTGVRDYIHVSDLATAHVLALDHLAAGGDSATLNCGYGHGYSVREVVDTVREVSGVDFEAKEVGRRAGDPASLTADSGALKALLGWEPEYDDLRVMVRTALEWERRQG
jgi:UDP-glucose 4-epimerase